MDHLLHCTKTCRPVHLVLITLLLLLLLSSKQEKYLAEGRSLFKLLEVAKEGGEEGVMMRALIGSRPPRCERKCTSCGHCEAVQVPIGPQVRNGGGHFFNTITSKGDDSSNYKPINWKCKCGSMLLNP
ncbi:EPIDERMAL PATTERNING FACTOR-like protein 2 [Elaeis guineensis]|uniref:Epidermal patterning factor-like protein n=1 Tax=Elaeis guineensis var. tenera TaxID=51953 RepID=A0A6I9SDS5_ELAGV|nr:EPIDERMAL PATTERNING FACTOR-like protein 2 [Elaeis guineensis]